MARSERTVRYVESGGTQIAYEAHGTGRLDVLMAFEWGANLDLMWENPLNERFLRRFTDYGRLINFDIRGTGLSDPVDRFPPIEEWVADVRAVMEAVGSERAALVGHGHAAQLFMLFAAMHPERTQALVTINGFARLRRDTDYPWGWPPTAVEALDALIRERWGTGRALSMSMPSMAQGPRGLDWVARLERAAGSPARAAVKQRMVFDLDVRDVLPAITSPTLVVHTRHNPYAHPDHGRFLVANIKGAKLAELPGSDHSPGTSEDADELMDVIEEFLTGTRNPPTTNRSLMTVAFTDIVGSTGLAVEMGDRRWRDLLETHESVAHREIADARGRLVKLTGDGLMAAFDGPARAVECIRALRQDLEPLGIRIRAGVHTGEVETLGDDLGGIAVHIAARVSALADAGEILVSSTVRDLVVGSGIVFEDRGEHQLKGVPDHWKVFAVV